MVVHQKGFFLRNFEKIISGFIALLILVALVYVINKNRAAELDELLDSIESSIVIINRGAVEPPEETFPPYLTLWAEGTEVRSPEEPASVFWPPFPEYYPEFIAGTDREYVLEFTEPIAEDSIEIEVLDGEDVLAVEDIVHPEPLSRDSSRVAIHTGSGEGRVRITARGSDRAHILEVYTDEAIDVPPSPPLNLVAQITRGRVEVYFEHNPDNEEGVIVEEYEIFRKRAMDILGRFELVDTVTVQSDELSSDARAALRDAGITPTEKRDTEERDIDIDSENVVYVWKDTDVNPEEVYLYKIRTVGLKSNPRRSDFTDLLRAETMPTMDFRYIDRIGDELEFEFALEVDNIIEKFPLEHVVGDRIGADVGYLEETREERREERREETRQETRQGRREIPERSQEDDRRRISFETRIDDYDDDTDDSFDTLCLILDFHRDALRRRPYSTGRIIYVDGKGRIQSRWRDYWRSESDDDYPWEPVEIEDDEDRRDERRPGLDPFGDLDFRDRD